MLLKRILCAMMMLVLCALCVPYALAEEPSSAQYVMAGFDDTQYRDWSNNQFFFRMEERTGMRFVYRQYTDTAQWEKAKADMTADGSLPDVLFKAALTTQECLRMRENGVLIDLKPYLEENCPNLWTILQEHPEYLEAITLPDGSIAALPYINSHPVQNYMWINQAWLDALRLDKPATAQELVDVLTAFKTRDPNRNNKKDEIPMGFLGPFDLKFLGHAFGLVANDYNIFVDGGQVKFMPLEENFRLFMTWCRDLYAEGLLDKNGFSLADTMRQVSDDKAVATYGIILTSVAADLFRVSWATDYTLLNPLIYEGKQIYRDFTGPVLRGTFAVTSACKEPEKMLQWVDYLYSEEGAILATSGLENVDYVVDGDHTWRLTDSVQGNSFFTSQTLIDGGGTLPGILAADFQRRFGTEPYIRMLLDAQDDFNQYTVMPFPYCALTDAQLEKVSGMQQEIGYYVDMQIARWVLGEEEITDETFAAFETTLNEKGLPAFLQFWQDVLDHR